MTRRNKDKYKELRELIFERNRANKKLTDYLQEHFSPGTKIQFIGGSGICFDAVVESNNGDTLSVKLKNGNETNVKAGDLYGGD